MAKRAAAIQLCIDTHTNTFTHTHTHNNLDRVLTEYESNNHKVLN